MNLHGWDNHHNATLVLMACMAVYVGIARPATGVESLIVTLETTVLDGEDTGVFSKPVDRIDMLARVTTSGDALSPGSQSLPTLVDIIFDFDDGASEQYTASEFHNFDWNFDTGDQPMLIISVQSPSDPVNLRRQPDQPSPVGPANGELSFSIDTGFNFLGNVGGLIDFSGIPPGGPVPSNELANVGRREVLATIGTNTWGVTGDNSTASFNAGVDSVTIIPEPSALAIATIGVLAVSILVRVGRR